MCIGLFSPAPCPGSLLSSVFCKNCVSFVPVYQISEISKVGIASHCLIPNSIFFKNPF